MRLLNCGLHSIILISHVYSGCYTGHQPLLLGSFLSKLLVLGLFKLLELFPDFLSLNVSVCKDNLVATGYRRRGTHSCLSSVHHQSTRLHDLLSDARLTRYFHRVHLTRL